jgi:glycosyltransferase involved in cell wall biosynthesis
MKVHLVGPVTPYSGYGNDTISLAKALQAWGAEVFLSPTHVMPPIPVETAMLLTKHLEAPFDLTICHVDPANIWASPPMKRGSTMTLGWTMWEWDRFGKELESTKHESGQKLPHRLDSFDLLAVYHGAVAEAVAEVSTTPTVVVQGGFDPEMWPLLQRDWNAPLRFFMEGVLNNRKAPFAAIHAFKQLKDEYPEDMKDVELHLKTMILGLHPEMEKWCPGLFIHLEVWKKEQLLDFYSKAHVLLAPSRGEGKNLPALQFMSTGGTVIATNVFGHTQWLSTEYAYALDSTWINDPTMDANWADPSVEHLKTLMLHCVRNRDEVRRKAELAARTIPLMCSWEAALTRLFDQLPGAHPAGATIREAAMRCRKERDEEYLVQRHKTMNSRLMSGI